MQFNNAECETLIRVVLAGILFQYFTIHFVNTLRFKLCSQTVALLICLPSCFLCSDHVDSVSVWLDLINVSKISLDLPVILFVIPLLSWCYHVSLCSFPYFSASELFSFMIALIAFEKHSGTFLQTWNKSEISKHVFAQKWSFQPIGTFKLRWLHEMHQ